MLESLNAILLLFFYFQESESQSLQFYLIVKLKIYLGLRPNFDIWYELNFFSLNDWTDLITIILNHNKGSQNLQPDISPVIMKKLIVEQCIIF